MRDIVVIYLGPIAHHILLYTRTVSQTAVLFPKPETSWQVLGKEQGFGEVFTKR